MKTNEALLLGGGLFAFLAFVLPKGLAASNLVFYPGSINSMAFVGSTPVVVFTMQVQNTSGTALTINSFAGNVTSNGTLIGNVYNFSPVVIPPNASVQIPVTAQLQALTLVNDLIRAFQYGNFAQSMELDAVANVQGIQVPVKQTFNIGIGS